MHVRAPQARGYLGECSFATVPTVRSRERAPCYLLPTDRAGGPRPAPQGASRVSGCHTRAMQRCRCRGRSSNARTGCALVPAHRQGRGTTTLTWGRGSPLLSLQGHKCLPTDRAGAPRTTHVEGAHHCYTAGSQVQATLPCTCGCQHWLIRSSYARTGCALVPAHRQGRGTTTLTWGRGSPLLSLQGHKCLSTDRAGAPRTTHVEGAHHCYTAGSQVQATLPCTCGCQHWLICSAILPVNADGLALCKVPAHRQGRGITNHTCGRGSPLLHSRVTSAGNAALHLRMPTLAYPQCTYCNYSSKIVSSTQQLTHTRDKRN